VLAALQRVPGTAWYIVAKEDSADVLGSVRTRGLTTVAIALVLVALAGLGALFIWRRRESEVSAEIRESEERYRALIEHAPMAIYVNRDDRVVLVNAACVRLFGATSPEQLLGRSPLELMHPDCHAALLERGQRLRDEGGEASPMEEKIVRLDGTIVDVEVSAAPFQDQGVTAIHVALNDITERKRAEKALLESEAALRGILDATPFPIALVDAQDDVIHYWSSSALALFGHTAPTASGWYDLAYPDPEYRQEVVRRWKPLLEETRVSGRPVNTGEYRIACRDGSERICELYATFVADRLVVTFNDITARKRADEARGEAERELAQLNVELEQRVIDRTAQLDAANKELEAFAYSVSHDLRAPLRHISGFSALLAERAGDDLDEKSRHYVDTISRSVREMGVLIDDLLQFSRTGRAELQITDVDMEEALREALEPLQRDLEDRDIEWSIGALPHVVGDHALLRQVWANLLGNAVKYTRGRTPARIEVGARDDGNNEDVFWVRDNGVGFDMAYVHKLFGVFQRLHDSSEFEGTGIGLANVQRIINRLGGRVWAEGAVGSGAMFFFSLPRRKDTTS
jgi:PAS domain S-box-containing protein